MTTDELARTFLFAGLDDAQLEELAAAGTVEAYPAGTVLFAEGAPADDLWVLLEGRIQLTRRLDHEEVVLATMDRAGSWAGGMRAYGEAAQLAAYFATGRAVEPSRVFRPHQPKTSRPSNERPGQDSQRPQVNRWNMRLDAAQQLLDARRPRQASGTWQT